MKPFLIITKKTLAVILAAIIIAVLVFSRIFFVEQVGIDGSTNQKRVVYMNSLGLQIDDSEVEAKEIVIPRNFDAVYKEYNLLQKKAGFDLSRFKNKAATLYTYWQHGKESQIHLIIYKGEIIGGDVADINVNGSMKPLIK